MASRPDTSQPNLPPSSAQRTAAEPSSAAGQTAPSPPASRERRSSRSKVHGDAPTQHAQPDRPAPKLKLDLKAVADVDGLEQEVAVLRASIRQLANDGEIATHVRVLAELRHQIEALCRALKTQQSLSGHDGDARAAELEQVLEELGDQLGVSR